MTWKSSWSIASDDDNSRQSFLSDCDSEFDLRPPPRYPAEKRSIARHEPPLTRARAKAAQQNILLPKEPPVSPRRRSIDSFTDMTSSLKISQKKNAILFPKQEPSHELFGFARTPADGVKTLTDCLESFSLDESQCKQ